MPRSPANDSDRSRDVPDETLEEAAQRLLIIVHNIARRFDGDAVVSPIAVPNDIDAARLILDRLERAVPPMPHLGVCPSTIKPVESHNK